MFAEAIAYRQADATKHENGLERMIVKPSFYHKIATDILHKCLRIRIK